jgi:hypothetical protein
MFSAYCPTHQSAVLLGPGNIEGLHNTTRGITVRFRCYCGYRGAFNDGMPPTEIT